MHPKKFIKTNSSLILSSAAGLGTVLTAYLSARASFEACRIIDEVEKREGYDDSPTDRLMARFRLVWHLYIPAGVSGAGTVVSLVASKRIDSRRTMAAQAGLALCERAYREYRHQIVEEFGDRKDKAIAARVAEKQVEDKPPPSIVAGSGTVLCCELWTMRYFNCDMQTLGRVVNEINSRMLKHDYATMDDFYYELGLENTPSSGHSGWSSDKLLDLEFSSILHNGVPVLAFQYNYVKSF
jgi:hypothetical protein